MQSKGLKLVRVDRSMLGSGKGGRCIALPPASFNSGRFSVYEPVVITSTVPGRPFAVCWIRPLKFSSLQLGCAGAPHALFQSLGHGMGLVDIDKLSSRPDIRVLDAAEVSLELCVSKDAQGERRWDKRWCEGDITSSRRGFLEHAVSLSAHGCYVNEGDVLAISLEGRTMPFVVKSISEDGGSRAATDKSTEEAMAKQFNDLTVLPRLGSKQKHEKNEVQEEVRCNNSSITLLEERLYTFYEKYNPSKMADVSALATKYVGREEEVFAQLQQKYHVAAAEVEKVQTSAGIDILLDSSSLAEDTRLPARFVWLVGNDTKMRIKWGETGSEAERGSVRINPSKDFSSYFLNIGGLDSQISELKEAVLLPLSRPELFLSLGVRPPRGVLLHGPPGTGKTTLAEAVACAYGFHVVRVHGSLLTSRAIGDGESVLRRYFDDAVFHAPAVILMDEIDTAFPSRDAMGGLESDRRLVSTLLSLLDGFCTHSETEPPVIVIACTNQPQALDPALRRPGRLDKEIEISVPDEKGREQILSVLLSQVPHLLSTYDIAEAASKAHGFVGADLQLLVKEATLIALRRIRTEHGSQSVGFTLCAEDVMASLRIVSPSGLREIAVEVPTVQWDDIGGHEWVKQILKEVAEWPLTHPEAFERMGITPPRGVLLYGPPGCSKTLMARALATESGMNFLAVKGPELLSKWLGESERTLQALYRRARLAAPTIIFFDEVDAIAGRRGGESGGASTATERVLSQLLTELDGIQPLKRVITVAATNRPDMIDPALLRPGRLDRLVYVPPPDLTSRKRIFEIGLQNMPTTSSINLNMLAEEAEGLSGAEVIGVCREAALGAIEENKDCVEQGHILVALRKVTPLITPEMLRFYDEFSTRGQKDGVGAYTSV